MKKTQTLLDKALIEKNKAIKQTFLAEWNPAQFKAIEKAICRHFAAAPIRTNKGEFPAQYRSFEALGDILGIAYTSSSKYAAYWVCNLEAFSQYPGFYYVGFAISESGQLYAILWNENENEILSPL